MYNRDSCYYNVFGNIETNHGIKEYEEALLREQCIKLNKNTNVKYRYKQNVKADL